MCIKKLIGLLVLAIPVFGIAQQIPLPVPAKPTVNASVTVTPPPAAIAKATVIAPGALTIQALSALQEQEMASAVAKQLGTVTPNQNKVADVPVAVIPVKADKPKPVAPNLESVVGPEGQEVASFRLDSGARTAVKVGESIGTWYVKQIANGRVQLEAKTAAGKKYKVRGKSGVPMAKAQWISVGEFLK